MRTERLAGIADLAADRAALAAGTDHAVADDANVRNSVGVVERVNAYGMDTKVMSGDTFTDVWLWLVCRLPRVAHYEGA